MIGNMCLNVFAVKHGEYDIDIENGEEQSIKLKHNKCNKNTYLVTDSIITSVFSEIVEQKQNIRSSANEKGDVFLEIKRQNKKMHSLDDYKIVVTKEHVKLVYFETLLKEQLVNSKYPLSHKIILKFKTFIAYFLSFVDPITLSTLATHYFVLLVIWYISSAHFLERISKLEILACSNYNLHKDVHKCTKCAVCFNEQRKNYDLMKILPFHNTFDDNF